MSTSRGHLLVALARNESLMSNIVKCKSAKTNENDDPTFSSPDKSCYQSSCSSSFHSSNLPECTRKELRELQNINCNSSNIIDNINIEICDAEDLQRNVDLGKNHFSYYEMII